MPMSEVITPRKPIFDDEINLSSMKPNAIGMSNRFLAVSTANYFLRFFISDFEHVYVD
jgi:hypothetical protein